MTIPTIHPTGLLPRAAIEKAMNAAIESLVEARGGRGYVPYDAVVVAANLLANVVMFAPEHQDGPASNAQRTVEVLGEVARLLANMPVLAVLPGGVK